MLNIYYSANISAAKTKQNIKSEENDDEWVPSCDEDVLLRDSIFNAYDKIVEEVTAQSRDRKKRRLQIKGDFIDPRNLLYKNI